jgi:2'-5' RNA ligase
MNKKFRHVTITFGEFNESKRGDLFEYGCVMIYPDITNWEEITSIIEEGDIYDKEPRYGIETDPHITVLYGLHKEVTANDIKKSLKRFKNKKIEIDIDGIGKFDSGKFSVIKLNVESSILNSMNKSLSKLPHTTDFPDYRPHMTIAYVKPGKADKYLNESYKVGFTSINKIVYKMISGEKIEFKL